MTEFPKVADIAALLGRDLHSYPAGVIRAARRYKWGYPVTVMSMMRGEGMTLSPGAEAEVARHSSRVKTYERVVRLVSDLGPLWVCKGPSIASRYPEGILRHSGDLDLVFADEDAVWSAARFLIDTLDVFDVTLTYFGPGNHLLVVLRWAGDDSLLDSEYSVDLMTTPFAGDGAQVFARTVPRMECLASLNLLCIAEERFQRSFGVSDMVDALVLLSVDGSLDEAVDRSIEMHLAPELLELVCSTGRAFARDVGGVPRDLISAVEAEMSRRDRQEARAMGDGETVDFFEHLDAGRYWFGIPADLCARSAVPTRAATEGGYRLDTPIGIFLAVAKHEYEVEHLEALRSS